MAAMHDEPVRVEILKGVATVTLARPDRQNAMSADMWRALGDICRRLAAESTLRALVLQGEPPAFSAGADIAEFEHVFADRASAAAYNAIVQGSLLALENLPVPTLAAIGGSCIGGGCMLALACDLRLAVEEARFAIPPARLGLVYGFHDTRRLVATVGAARAKDMLFSARVLDAAEAYRIGLVDRVVAKDALAAAVAEQTAAWCALSGNSQRAMKRMVGLAQTCGGDEPEAAREMRDEAVEHADFVEGRAAFLEKRRPVFR